MQDLQIIIGLNRTGLSCARYLAERNEKFILCDTRVQLPQLAALQTEFPAIAVHCGPLSEPMLLKASRIIVSPGVGLHEPAIAAVMKQGVSIIGDIELFAQQARAPIAAITGTNAKGTVTTMLSLMAEQAGRKILTGGNIGIPALELLTKPVPDLYVLELSSFQLESTFSLAPLAATILNISSDHLDHHRDMTEYIAAKQRIYHAAQNIIINRADGCTYPKMQPGSLAANQWSFGLNEPVTLKEFGCRTKDDILYLAHGEKLLMPINDLQIAGLHNVENALAALALGTAIDLPIAAMLQALRKFKGLPHRCQLIRIRQGVRWYNDSKATNIGATIAALKGFAHNGHKKLILIAGGDSKGADFNSMRSLIGSQVNLAILFGKDAAKLAKNWYDVTTILLVNDLTIAVKIAADAAASGDIVLLSPACSSLDMFKNFAERGEIFANLVSQL